MNGIIQKKKKWKRANIRVIFSCLFVFLSTVDNLHGIVLDLFLAGTDTTSSALRWAILLLTNYPDVAEKCYQEIRRVVGLERLPTFQDKAELKYVNATILEVLRWSNIVPIVTRTNPQDTTFLGYNVPKRSLIFIILTTAMRDPDVWGDPNNFRPERFLESDRELSRFHESIPFGIGKCPGIVFKYFSWNVNYSSSKQKKNVQTNNQ